MVVHVIASGMNFLKFIMSSPRFLAFGFLTAFFSSFGQTYFISLSGAEIRSTFDLSHGDFGFIYSVGTLSSAAILVWAGRKIDDWDLRIFTSIVCVGLAVACLGMSMVTSAAWLYLIIFGLRFTGQGLLSHTSATSMARYFGVNRGKALSIAGVGYPVGEALFPTVVVILIATYGWRQMWGGVGIMLLIGLVPIILWLLKGHGERQRQLVETQHEKGHEAAEGAWSRRHVLRDPRFYILMPCFFSTSFVVTGLFFHQVHLVESKGWEMPMFAGAFVVFAVGQVAASLLAGVLVDKYGATRLFKFYLIPMIAALLIFSGFDSEMTAFVFMALLGMSSGMGSVITSAIWAEIYGVTHLGAIKALGTALMVMSSALSPAIMGWAIDADVSMENITAVSALYCVGASLLVAILFQRFDRAIRSNQR